MSYTIGEISKLFNIPISTLRYYDKEGLFPEITRISGIRKFKDKDIEAIRIIDCLKKSGMEIKEIKLFMQWCTEGAKTYLKRKELIEARKTSIESEINELQKHLAMLSFKNWYYEQAIKDGNEENVKSLIPNNLPNDIKKLYDIAHS